MRPFLAAIKKIRHTGWTHHRLRRAAAKVESSNGVAVVLRWLLMLCGLIYGTQASGGGSEAMQDKTGLLEHAHPEIRYPANELDRSAGEKFLLFDIFQVVNPSAVPLAFTVYYQKPGQGRLYLGSFALYPADNPGRFIVPTQGKVSRDGEVFLSLVPLEQEDGAQAVQIKLREVKLVDQLAPL